MGDEHEIAVQSAIPLFDGNQPESELLKFSGDLAPTHGDIPQFENRIGYAIVSYVTGPVTHKRDGDGFLERIATLKVHSGVVIDNSVGKALIDEWRNERLKRINERNAQGVLVTDEQIREFLENDANRIPPVGYRAAQCPDCNAEVIAADDPEIPGGLYDWPGPDTRDYTRHDCTK